MATHPWTRHLAFLSCLMMQMADTQLLQCLLPLGDLSQRCRVLHAPEGIRYGALDRLVCSSHSTKICYLTSIVTISGFNEARKSLFLINTTLGPEKTLNYF